VYLSGGTTYIPAVRDAIARFFRVPIRTGVPPEHAVCLGAAIHAAQIQFHARQTLAER
jgi:molecular chaperone DnaK (HSP70)